ncbi:MAG: carboxylating nicotinate-nucleotide diphosphorylase [Planctomycetota bacterium]|nr:MAG: carboxylating nicotinate-nucleotide diphosphorylase [Planctomycetota bacterium]
MSDDNTRLVERRRQFARAISPPPGPAADAFGDVEAFLERFVADALKEDIGPGDATTAIAVPKGATGTGFFVTRTDGVLAGLPLAEMVFLTVDFDLQLATVFPEGERYTPGDRIAEIRGDLAAILTAERVALNLLQRLCGIATLTRRFVDAVSGTGAKILDTRKTVPHYRLLDKYAVRKGGGTNHRFGLHDAVFIKDNHITAARASGAKSRAYAIGQLLQKARSTGSLPVIIEVENVEEAVAASCADVILLDNMPLDEMRAVVKKFSKLKDRGLLEASGGVTLENIRAIAETGIDRISIGALTHSAPAADISLEVS